jgi:hypothetical protein
MTPWAAGVSSRHTSLKNSPRPVDCPLIGHCETRKAQSHPTRPHQQRNAHQQTPPPQQPKHAEHHRGLLCCLFTYLPRAHLTVQVEAHCNCLERLARPAYALGAPATAASVPLLPGESNFSSPGGFYTPERAEQAYQHALFLCKALRDLTSPGTRGQLPSPSSSPQTAAVGPVQSPFFPRAQPPHKTLFCLATVPTRTVRSTSKASTSPISLPRMCQSCGVTRTPEWRTGPHGSKTYRPTHPPYTKPFKNHLC